MAAERTPVVVASLVDSGTDSHAPPKKPRPKAAVPGGPGTGATHVQNGLDVPAAVPLHERPVLDYAELAALGVIPERTLRRLVAIGRVKRAVLRSGRRVRFVVRDLLDEMREVGE
jgi:hypothetical protein